MIHKIWLQVSQTSGASQAFIIATLCELRWTGSSENLHGETDVMLDFYRLEHKTRGESEEVAASAVVRNASHRKTQ